MKNFEIRINPKDIIKGGMRLWEIETKERLYNGRLKMLILAITSIIFIYYSPIVSYLIIGLVLVAFIVDYCLNFIEYRNLAKQHERHQLETYFLQINEVGFSHTLTENKEKKIINLWKSYNYLIDVEKEGFLILKDNDGATNLYFKSWMSEQAFYEFKAIAYKKIGKKLNNRFV